MQSKPSKLRSSLLTGFGRAGVFGLAVSVVVSTVFLFFRPNALPGTFAFCLLAVVLAVATSGSLVESLVVLVAAAVELALTRTTGIGFKYLIASSWTLETLFVGAGGFTCVLVITARQRAARAERLRLEETQQALEAQRNLTEQLRQDISARQAAQKALEESELRYRRLFEANAAGIYRAELKGRILDCNVAAASMLGYTREEVIGRPGVDFFFDPAEEAAASAALAQHKVLTNLEVRLRHKDGSMVWAIANVSLLNDEASGTPIVEGTFINITELKRAQALLAKNAEELERSNAELERFASVASHDLQEPLRSVSGFARLLEKNYKGRLDPKADEYIHFMIDGATRMSRFIHDLLAYARVSRRAWQPKRVDTNEIVRRAIASLHGAISESKASVSYEQLPEVEADPSQLQQVFQNLIGNAIKFRSDREPAVHVSARTNGSDWLFSVRDNGIGIDPRFQKGIFGMFQRLHTRTEYAGSGIGLAICERIIEHHGGRIWVESTPGRGSTFYFTIPKQRPADSVPRHEQARIGV